MPILRLIFALLPFLLLPLLSGASGEPSANDFLLELAEYEPVTGDTVTVLDTLLSRIEQQPFNVVATGFFFLAICHTFCVGYFRKLSHYFERRHLELLHKKGIKGQDIVCYKAELFHFLAEVEVVFGIWVVPLLAALVAFYGWDSTKFYMSTMVDYTEPMFVVVIMAIASTRPILKFAEMCMRGVASIGKGSPAAWWVSILVIAPLLGSFITEPAAMTIAASLLGFQFYRLQPSSKLAYATLGLLFVNISVGGTLTNFAAPPVIMVAQTWGWDIAYMLRYFGVEAIIGILISTSLYYVVFRKELKALGQRAQLFKGGGAPTDRHKNDAAKIPPVVTTIHLLFLVWTVFTAHYPVLFIGGFLFFLAFTRITLHHQYDFSIRQPLLVGFFLAGLVTHGRLQAWWIEPVIGNLESLPLFIGSTVLTAFNDNAAITYLASLVPEFRYNSILQQAVVAGAVTGGGLTVIANAPNPAGQALLSKYFPRGIAPLYLFLGALLPTLILGVTFITLDLLY